MYNLLKYKIIKPIWHSKLSYEIRGYVFIKFEKLTNYYLLRKKFKKKHGYKLKLDNPKTFSEKVNYKKLFDNSHLIPITADKVKVRDYVREVLGDEEGDKILVPLLIVTDNPKEIPFNNMPNNIVIKSNHGSGQNIFIRNINEVNKNDIINECMYWLNRPYGLFGHEWYYLYINRKVIVEKIINDNNGNIPWDYKFYIFHGKAELLHVDFDRQKRLKRTFYEPRTWKYLNIKYKRDMGPKIEKPKNLAKMIEIAEALGAKFDFVRVDLYNVNGQIYFGEISHGITSGMGKFEPENIELELGKKWKLNTHED